MKSHGTGSLQTPSQANSKLASKSPNMSVFEDYELIFFLSLIIIHGIRETLWSEERGPFDSSESSTEWIKRDLGFESSRFMHFYYDIRGSRTTEPALFYCNGFDNEARKLLDQLVELRNSPADNLVSSSL